MNEIEKFQKERQTRIESYGENSQLQNAAKKFMAQSVADKYSYNFTWMGRPIIQYPQDMVAMQEIIWSVKPDLIIETGIAHGGSLIMYASFLHMIGGVGHVLGIDIDIREHNKKEIEAHPMSSRITMIQGSSISAEVAKQVHDYAKNFSNIMVVLDSNHTHEHVLKELELYSSLVTLGSYCVVFDTVIEDGEKGGFPDRPWDVGNNPKTAVWEFLKNCPDFEIDQSMDNKLLISVAPNGYLKKIR
jgi:cephalosporin hydroxylase